MSMIVHTLVSGIGYFVTSDYKNYILHDYAVELVLKIILSSYMYTCVNETMAIVSLRAICSSIKNMGVYCLPLSVLPSVHSSDCQSNDFFCHIFLRNYIRRISEIWFQGLYKSAFNLFQDKRKITKYLKQAVVKSSLRIT